MTEEVEKKGPVRVLVESPLNGGSDEATGKNLLYARCCVRDSVSRGEAPYASHLFYTQSGILNDNIPEERQQGIDSGLTWGSAAEKSAVYTDLGVSRGMEYGIANAEAAKRPIEMRSLGTPDEVEALIKKMSEEKPHFDTGILF